jgi:pSer/pThr/pTyr-binding forkhead associated (FHA) protein
MSVALVIYGKKGTRKDFGLHSGSMIIGRKMDADLRIPLSEVSRSHCEIRVDGNEVTLRDLGSCNGTFVNDRKITRAVLKAGDRITVGPVVFTVQIDGAPAEIPPAGSTPGVKAAPQASTRLAGSSEQAAADLDDFDIDELGELDIDDISDLDLGDLATDDSDDSDELEEIDDLEEIDETDLVPDEDSGESGKK